MSKQLELVRSFYEVCAGMDLVYIACDICGRAMCTGTVAALVEAEGEDEETTVWAWKVEPWCGPDKSDDYFNGIDADMIAQGRVFRVVEGVSAGSNGLMRVKSLSR